MAIPYRGAGLQFFRRSGGDVELLLGCRTDHPFKDHWSVPGGKMSRLDGGNFWTCALREAQEEFGDFPPGLVPKNPVPFHRFYYPFFFEYRVYFLPVERELPDHWPSHNHEFSAWAWHSPRNWPENIQPQIVTAYDSWRKRKL